MNFLCQNKHFLDLLLVLQCMLIRRNLLESHLVELETLLQYKRIVVAIQDKISRLNLVDNIHLKGQLIYSNFGKIITNYDLFIGSGTAIIEASSLGVCSIVGVESIQSPQSYGYFTSCADFDYNLGSLDIEKVPVQGLIKKFIAMAVSEKNELSKEHVDVMSQFYIETCSDNFEKLKDYATLQEEFIVNGFFYEINTLFHKILKRILKSHPLNFKYGN